VVREALLSSNAYIRNLRAVAKTGLALRAILEATGDPFRGEAALVRRRAFRPSDRVQNRIQTRCFRGREASGVLLCS